MNKKLNNKGETIVETLVAILIVAVCFIMLQNAVVSSARLNSKSNDENEPFLIEDVVEQTSDNCKIYVTRNSVQTNVTSMKCYKTNGGYYYYE